MFVVLGKNMAIVLTNKRCCGKLRVCGLQSSLSDGVTLLPLHTTIWCWPANWSKCNCVRGKASSAHPPRNRCDAGLANCCHLWEPLPSCHNLAENRKAAKKGHQSRRLHALRSSVKPQ